jgi:hypothetical protein
VADRRLRLVPGDVHRDDRVEGRSEHTIPVESYRIDSDAFRAEVDAFIAARQVGEDGGVPIVAPEPGEDAYLQAMQFQFRPVLQLQRGQTHRLLVSSTDAQHGLSLQLEGNRPSMNFQVLPDYLYVIRITPTGDRRVLARLQRVLRARPPRDDRQDHRRRLTGGRRVTTEASTAEKFPDLHRHRLPRRALRRAARAGQRRGRVVLLAIGGSWRCSSRCSARTSSRCPTTVVPARRRARLRHAAVLAAVLRGRGPVLGLDDALNAPMRVPKLAWTVFGMMLLGVLVSTYLMLRVRRR